MEVPTEKGMRTPIQRLGCTEGIRSLGVRFTLNGRYTAEFNYLLHQIEEWGRVIKLAPLSRWVAWAALLQCASKSLEYPLAVVTFDDQQCNKLDKALQQAFIQKVGVSSKFPTAPRTMPTKFSGLGFPHTMSLMVDVHIRIFLTEITKHTMVGELLQGIIEFHQIEIGTGTPIFDLDFDKYHHLVTETWITHLWKLCSQHNIAMKVYKTTTIPLAFPVLNRQNDRYLTEMVLALPHVTKKEQVQFNTMYKHLQVLTLADITTGDGTQITVSAKEGKRDKCRTSQYKWPKEAPTQKTNKHGSN